MLERGSRYVLDFLPERRAVYGDMETIDDDHALAIFHANLAAEALIAARFDDAVAHSRVALRLHPRLSDAWNNMGAAQWRLGRAELAITSYQQVIRLDPRNTTAMSNLARIYSARGDEAAADRFAGRVARHRQRNPYFHFANAELALRRAQPREARRHLEEAIRLKRDDATFFDALAEAYAQLGDAERARLSRRAAASVRESDSARSSLSIYRPGNVVLQ